MATSPPRTPEPTAAAPSMEIDGVPYFGVAAVAKEVGVSRQTLWRWRHEGKIPPGRRYRDGQILFNVAEFNAVRRHANRLEPADVGLARPTRTPNQADGGTTQGARDSK